MSIHPSPLRADPVVSGFVEARNAADRLLEGHVRAKEHPAITGLRTALEQGRGAYLSTGAGVSIFEVWPSGERFHCWNGESVYYDGDIDNAIAAARRVIALSGDVRSRIRAFSRIRPPTVAATEDR